MFRSTLKAIQAIQPHSWPPKWDLYAQAACQQSTFFHIYRCWNCCQSGLGLCCRSYTELCQGNSIKLKAFIAFNSELQAQISTHSSLAPGLGSGTTRTTGSFLFTKKKRHRCKSQVPLLFFLSATAPVERHVWQHHSITRQPQLLARGPLQWLPRSL